MAVEIPVYINIQDAFNQAAREIPKELPKLEKALSSQALKVDFGGNNMRTLLTDSTLSATTLEKSLRMIRREFEAVSSGSQKARRGMNVDNLIKSYALLEQRISGAFKVNTVLAMKTEVAIGKVQQKIQKLKATLSSASPNSDLFNKTNYELQLQQRRLAQLTTQLMQYKAGIDSTNASFSKQNSILKSISGYFGGLYAVHTLTRFVKQIRDVTGELEYQRVALGHLLQDVDFGNELFGKIIEAAKESPFRIKNLVEYTKQLAAYRVEEDQLFDTTMRLADISAGLGVDMNRLILAFGQVRAASVLRGQELRQFTEAGIPLVELLAKKFRDLGREGTTTADVFKLISERAVPFEYIKEIFEELTDAGGMFYKMQEEQAKTLRGRWEKLKDAYDQALMTMGEDDTFKRWNDIVLNLLNGLAKNLKGIVRVLNAGSIAWVAYWVATKSGLSYGARLTAMFIKEYGAVNTLRFGVVGLTNAFKKLWIVMKSNWVGLAISAIAGAITWLTTFRNKTKEATSTLSEMGEAMENMKIANKEFALGKELINSYKELASNTERTADQNKRLSTVMDELKKLYPDITGKIDAENMSLEAQIALLTQVADKKHENAVDEAKRRLQTQENVISGLEQEAAARKEVLDAARLEEERFEKEKKVQQARERALGLREGSTDEAKRIEEFLIQASNAAKVAQDAYDESAKSLSAARKEAEELRNVIDPKSNEKDWQQWALQVKELQDSMVGLGDTPVFTDDELQNFTSVYDLSGKLKKKIDDLTTSVKGMKTQFESMADKGTVAAQALSGEIKASEKTLEIAEAIRLSLGLVFGKSGGSDSRLSDLKKDISEITNAYKKFLELRKYMSEDSALEEIAKLFPQLKGFEPTLKNTIDRIKGLLDDYKGPKDKVFLEMQRAIDTEVSNLNFDNLKKKISDDLKRISDEIKHSETARNFYQNILGLTGDEDIAKNMTLSVYGEVGDEFKDRIQAQLDKAFDTFDVSDYDLWDKMRTAISNQDWKTIMANLDKFAEEWQSRLKEMSSDNEKYNADWAENILKTYQKTKTYEERITDIHNQEEQKRNEISESEKISDDQRASLIAASKKKEAEEIAKVQLEALKDTYTWTKAFEDLDGVSSRTLENLIDLIDEYIKKHGKDLAPGQLKQLTRQREQARAQQLQRNSIAGIADAISKLTSKENAYNIMLDRGMDLSGALAEIQDEQLKSLKELGEAYEKATNEMNQYISSAKDLMAVFASDEDASFYGGLLDDFSKIFGGIGKAKTGILGILINPANTKAWAQAFSGLADIVTGVFSAINESKLRRINRDIEHQQDLLDDLADDYNRLEKAMAKAFGSDYIYNYNKQLENLNAQVAAYNAQADLERQKGKKADQNKIEEYEKSARSAAEQIEEMTGKLAEYFSGTDLESAAKDFAQSWIEAYREFGSTTDAMKEKFQDMVENMVTQSLAAKVMQSILDPLFKQIDEMAASDEMLSAQEIAQIANLAPEYIEQINAAMTGLMNQLGAAGYNMRQNIGGFTGISRDIAGASEESINGLAAGINTQNFYMSLISQNVAAILAAMTGEAVEGATGATAMDPYKEQMLLYIATLPQMRDDMYAIRTLLERVIKPNGTTATHYVSTRM